MQESDVAQIIGGRTVVGKNNVAQQALLYGDGWYGTYDLESGEHRIEKGSAALKACRVQDDTAKVQASVSAKELEPAVAALHQGSAAVKLRCANLIARACFGRRPQHKMAIHRLKAVPVLLDMALGGSQGEVAAACAALASVCYKSRLNSQSVAQRSGLSILIGAMQSGGPDVKAPAAEAIANILRFSHHHRNLLPRFKHPHPLHTFCTSPPPRCPYESQCRHYHIHLT